MIEAMNRRRFVQLGLTAGAATVLSRAMSAQAATAPQPSAAVPTTPVKVTRLYDNLYLLQGEGGNMALQTGREGDILIDSSYAPQVPRIREAIAAASSDAPFALINTHWHPDHTGGNEALHSAGFTIFAHRNTRTRMAEPHTIKLFHHELPASPPAALPAITFGDALHLWHNGDSISLVHFDPAHTDTDIYIHFENADVLHLGDTWFNGFYPFIDEGTGGSIGGMIAASDKALTLAGNGTKIVPGHGPLGSKADLQKCRDMLAAVRDKVAALKSAGASEQEAIAKKPTAGFDEVWGKGFLTPDIFAGIVYRTL